MKNVFICFLLSICYMLIVYGGNNSESHVCRTPEYDKYSERFKEDKMEIDIEYFIHNSLLCTHLSLFR